MALSNDQEHGDIVGFRRSKHIRKEKFFGFDLFIYLVKETRDSTENEILYVSSAYSYLISFQGAMES